MLRNEYKYIVPINKMDSLRDMINSFVVLDKFSELMPDKQYTVRSIYFDSPMFNCYFEKVEGLKHRKKFRLRGYNNEENPDNPVFFEIKNKYEVPIFKNRAPSCFNDAKSIFQEGKINGSIKNDLKFPCAYEDSQRFFYHYLNERLRPVILIIYEREAYVGRFDNKMRVTFDKHLRSMVYPSINDLYKSDNLRFSLTDHFILEVKFNDAFPAWMKPVIANLGLKRGPASKYTISLDEHNIVPGNRLRTVFSRSKLLNKHTNSF